MLILGIDPGLSRTGWGIVAAHGHALGFVAGGVITTTTRHSLPQRLVQLAEGLEAVIVRHRPSEAAVEETFVNLNATSTLRLGQARGTALLVLARAGLAISEYLPNLVKKAVVGYGHADKEQIARMVRVLLPTAATGAGDTADALAVAICHAHHRQSLLRQGGVAR